MLVGFFGWSGYAVCSSLSLAVADPIRQFSVIVETCQSVSVSLTVHGEADHEQRYSRLASASTRTYTDTLGLLFCW